MICDFAGCDQPMSEFSKNLNSPTELRFCEDHDEEFAALIKTNNVEGTIRFYIKSRGGSKALTEEILGEKPWLLLDLP